MGCSASRSDGLEHEEALQHVIQMMRELKVKQIASIAARREGRRSREKYYGWAGVQGARAIAGGDAVLRKASISRGEGSRAPPMWGLLSLSLETSSCVIYTFFQRSGRERYAVVIRGVICGLS